MAKSGFYNQNVNRAFPFQTGTTGNPLATAGTVEALPDSIIADAGFVINNGSGFETGVHRVWLDKIQRTGSLFVFTFASDAPGLYSLVLEFTRDAADSDLQVQFVADTLDAGFLKPKYSESVSIDPDPVSACFFLGSAGTFRPPRSGPLRFYFNDSYFPDNAGSFTLVFDGHTYVVPCTAEGIVGPYVHAGHAYSYTATGTIMYRPHPDPANNQHATPNGDTHNPFQTAPWECPCPGLRYYGLVAKLLEVNKFSESVAVSETQVIPAQLWSGYLVTGSMADLLALLPGDGTVARNTSQGGLAEPALIQNLAGAYVTSINIANQDRTRVTAADGCPETSWPYPVGPEDIYTNATQLMDNVRFLGGFNMVINQDIYSNAITLAASTGAGAGEVCEEVPLFFGEEPPFDRELLDGSLMCSEVIQSVNGLGGEFVSLISGQGVTITPVPASHKLVINADMSQMAVCYSQGLDVSEMSETLP